MDSEYIRQWLERHGFSEVAEVTTFKGYRGANMAEVTVQIFDHGPQGTLRYTVVATDKSGRVATGNGSTSIDDALATTHWFDLDPPISATED